LKNKSFLTFLIFLLFVGGGQINAFGFEMGALSKLDSLSIECLKNTQVSNCQQALLQAEVLQRQAASDGNYACQSRLLGLGADLLMISFKAGRSGSVLKMLEEVKVFCRDF